MKPLASRLLLLLLLGALSVPEAAWSRARPRSSQGGARPLGQVARATLPAVDVGGLLADDEVAKQLGLPPRFAVGVPVALGPETDGSWETLADGSRLWRLRLVSPGARSLSLELAPFQLPVGARLWLYDPRRELVQGPFTRRDRGRRGRFFSPVVLGDELVMELWLPTWAHGRTRLEVRTVHHGYRPFGRDIAKQGSCNIDVVCPDGDLWRDQVRAVGVYTIDGEWACTGTLLNNTNQDLKPYLLTAYHCGVTTGNDDTVVVYWNYQSAACGDLGGGPLDVNQRGAVLRTTWEAGDFALLELTSKPAAEAAAYYAGWDATGNRPQSTVVIHHPSTEEKAISFDDDAPTDSPNLLTSSSALTHWRVNNYERGTTEPGSSGACLFDEASKLCIGMLTGGEASCSLPSGFDIYGKLAVGWNGGGAPANRLRDWLDPIGLGTNKVVSGRNAATNTGPCLPSPTKLCLLGGRYEASLTWANQFDGTSGVGGAVPYTAAGGDFTGFFWFTDPANLELMLKILELGDGVVKVFYGQLTNFQFQLTVREVASGRTKTYTNGPEECGAIDQDFGGVLGGVLAVGEQAAPAVARCRPDGDTLCLLGRRFQVEVDWRNQFNGESGRGLQSAQSDLSGLFYYTDPRNVELLTKVLDFGDRILFIWGALSDLEYTIRVTDTSTGLVKEYSNPAGRFCGGIDEELALPEVVQEVEPNDTPEQAQVLPGPSPVNLAGNLEVADVGTIEINFQSGARDDVEDLYRVTLTAAGLSLELGGLAADADLYLINSGLDQVIDQANEAGTASERIDVPTLAPGTYYIGVTIYDPEPLADTTPYTLRVSGGL